MKFEEILPALRGGKKIKRLIWEKDYLYRDGDYLCSACNNGKEIDFYSSAIFEVDDWEIIEEPKQKVKYYPVLVKWDDEPRLFIDAQESSRFKSTKEAHNYYKDLECNKVGSASVLLFIRLITEIPELIEEREE